MPMFFVSTWGCRRRGERFGNRLQPASISKKAEKISPYGRARDAPWPRYQGRAVTGVQGRPGCLADENSERMTYPGYNCSSIQAGS